MGVLGLLLFVGGCSGGDSSPGEDLPFETDGAGGSAASAADDPESDPDDPANDPQGHDSGPSGGEPDEPDDDPKDETTDGGSTGDDRDCDPGTQDCACDNGTCEGNLRCYEDVCQAQAACGGDAHEPNETEATAAFLGDISDDDDDGSSFGAILAGAQDVDWFYYTGTDEFLSVVDPVRELTTDGGLRMCKFAECTDGGSSQTEVDCVGDATAETSAGGRPGCCAPGSVEIDVNCPGIDDDASIYIRVDQGQEVCVSYTVEFHY